MLSDEQAGCPSGLCQASQLLLPACLTVQVDNNNAAWLRALRALRCAQPPPGPLRLGSQPEPVLVPWAQLDPHPGALGPAGPSPSILGPSWTLTLHPVTALPELMHRRCANTVLYLN